MILERVHMNIMTRTEVTPFESENSHILYMCRRIHGCCSILTRWDKLFSITENVQIVLIREARLPPVEAVIKKFTGETGKHRKEEMERAKLGTVITYGKPLGTKK